MSYLGIDFGESNIGLAHSEGRLASRYKTISCKNALNAISLVCDELDVTHIVIGLPKGRLESKVRHFARELEKETKKKVSLIDETLSTYQAKRELIELGGARKARKRNEHMQAAVIILQKFLDAKK